MRIASGGVSHDERLVPLHELTRRIVRSPPAVAMPKQFVEVRVAGSADDHELVAVEATDDPVADDHRRADPAANASAAGQLTRKGRVLRHVGEDLCPLRPDDLTPGVALVVQVVALPEESLQVFEAAPADDHP